MKKTIFAAIVIFTIAICFLHVHFWTILDFFLHIDRHLSELSAQYGVWLYAILFLIIFCETGLIITPFLPGDSLLFTAGSVAALGNLDPYILGLLLICAAVLGDTINFSVGKYAGIWLFSNPNSKIFRQDYLHKTESYYEKYGGKTIILARFIPIVRTFAPFVAGMSSMNYRHFVFFNISGACIWVISFIFLGYSFGQAEFVRKNLSLVLVAIIVISILPAIIEFIRHRRKYG